MKSGELSLGRITPVLQEEFHRLDVCYLQLEAGYTKEPPKQLVFQVLFEVGADGRARAVTRGGAITSAEESMAHGGLGPVEGSSTGDESVYEAMFVCVRDALQKVLFPQSAAGSRAVRLRMMYESAARGGLRGRALGVVVPFSKNEIRSIIGASQSRLRECGLDGAVTLVWMVDSRGTTKDARVEGTGDGGQALEECLLRVVSSWEFPQPVGGGEVEISWSVSLSEH
ncbi:hypothetical protein ACFL6C_05885 [Myxococcota bacterium]